MRPKICTTKVILKRVGIRGGKSTFNLVKFGRTVHIVKNKLFVGIN